MLRFVFTTWISSALFLGMAHARSYKYDKVGRLTLAVYESGEAIQYVYTHGNNIKEVKRFQLPVAPTDLAATRTFAQRAEISWQDNSEDETGFRIFRRHVFGSNWQAIADVAADETSYTDEQLIDNENYVYRIAALSDNEDGFHSAYSTEVAASGEGSIQFSITGFSLDDKDTAVFLLRFQASSNATYTLQSSLDLTAGSWSEHPWSASSTGPFSSATIDGSDAPLSIYLETTPDNPRFYRLLTNGL